MAISLAIASERAVISSNVRRRHSARCRGGVAARPGSASYAAETASRASSAVPSATSATASSVAGSITGSVPPPRPAVHSPPMSRPWGPRCRPVRLPWRSPCPPGVWWSLRGKSLLSLAAASGSAPSRSVQCDCAGGVPHASHGVQCKFTAMSAGFDPETGLGPRLRVAREERQWSVRELARRIGCSASLVSQIERGISVPSVGVLYALATELGTSLDHLVLGADGLRAAGLRAAGLAAEPPREAGGPAGIVQRAADPGCHRAGQRGAAGSGSPRDQTP